MLPGISVISKGQDAQQIGKPAEYEKAPYGWRRDSGNDLTGKAEAARFLLHQPDSRDGRDNMKKRGKHPVILRDVLIKNLHKEDKR